MLRENRIHSEFWFPQQVIISDDSNFKKVKNKFLDYCKGEYKKDVKGEDKSNSLGWQSGNLPSKGVVYEYIKQGMEACLRSQINFKENITFSLSNYWVNISPKYASNDYHFHGGSDYSGCLYIQGDKNCGTINLNPHLSCDTTWMDSVTYEYKTAYHIYPSAQFEAVEGRMILFPSYVMHKVHPNLSSKERISIAFNIGFH